MPATWRALHSGRSVHGRAAHVARRSVHRRTTHVSWWGGNRRAAHIHRMSTHVSWRPLHSARRTTHVHWRSTHIARRPMHRRSAHRRSTHRRSTHASWWTMHVHLATRRGGRCRWARRGWWRRHRGLVFSWSVSLCVNVGRGRLSASGTQYLQQEVLDLALGVLMRKQFIGDHTFLLAQRTPQLLGLEQDLSIPFVGYDAPTARCGHSVPQQLAT